MRKRIAGWFDPLWVARRLLRRALAERAHWARGRLLDLGSGTAPYDGLFAQVTRRVRLDLPPHRPVDVVGDGMALPFRAGVFDTVLCNQVLEHVREPSQLLAEAARVLTPGGMLLLTTPMTWGLHLEPHDYYRYTPHGLRYLAVKAGLVVVEVAPTSGLWATLAQRCADTIVNNYGRGRSRLAYRILAGLVAPVLATGYALEMWAGKRGDALDHILIARKE